MNFSIREWSCIFHVIQPATLSLCFECCRNCPARWMDVSLHLIIIDSSQRSPKETVSCDPIKAGVGQAPLNHHLSLIIYSLVLLIMYCNMCYRYHCLSNISELLQSTPNTEKLSSSIRTWIFLLSYIYNQRDSGIFQSPSASFD